MVVERLTPTAEEARAIRSLKRLAKRWPDSLWLWSGAGTLWVMRKSEHGDHAMKKMGGSDSVDPAYALESVDIENSGGDW